MTPSSYQLAVWASNNQHSHPGQNILLSPLDIDNLFWKPKLVCCIFTGQRAQRPTSSRHIHTVFILPYQLHKKNNCYSVHQLRRTWKNLIILYNNNTNKDRSSVNWSRSTRWILIHWQHRYRLPLRSSIKAHTTNSAILEKKSIFTRHYSVISEIIGVGVAIWQWNHVDGVHIF